MNLEIFKDVVFDLYVSISVVNAYAFMLLFCWWISVKKAGRHASAVFLYVMYLVGGLSVSMGITGYCRYLMLTDITSRNDLLNSTMWHVRLWLILIPSVAFAIQMSLRAFGKKNDI